ncbi:hypothetical protein GBAR_LOCUS12769 [Geodia barretti]|uniref:Uncharacterized protein n=1 Tax=Geodia barretti TaxID=519541 RepID=A0AA35S2R9_GEOBA|nr:hypothetical protein GBAR_LOCUS12769 [Geodia barretti]
MEYIERMESRGRSVLGEVKVHDNAAAFAPRREIPRTPPRLFHHQPLKPASPTVSASVKPGERDSGPRLHGKSSANPSKLGEGGCENDPPANRGSPFNQRGAQAPCFTPRKSLARSPPRPITPTTPNNAPPPTRFEIPRTPLAIKPVSPPQRKVEVHQLPRVESRTSQIQPAPAQKEPAPPKPVSPPIITADSESSSIKWRCYFLSLSLHCQRGRREAWGCCQKVLCVRRMTWPSSNTWRPFNNTSDYR